MNGLGLNATSAITQCSAAMATAIRTGRAWNQAASEGVLGGGGGAAGALRARRRRPREVSATGWVEGGGNGRGTEKANRWMEPERGRIGPSRPAPLPLRAPAVAASPAPAVAPAPGLGRRPHAPQRRGRDGGRGRGDRRA